VGGLARRAEFRSGNRHADAETLRVEGISGTSATLAVSDLHNLRPRTVTTTDHGTPVTFDGVLLTDVLGKARIPSGEEFHNTAASYDLLAEGKDGYRTVFAWAELDPSFTDKAVYLVTRRDGRPPPENEGPFELVVPGRRKTLDGCDR
jgi:hypothetical protein